MANLVAAFELSDRVYVYDNSRDGFDATLYARVQEGLLRKIYGPLPTWVEHAVGALPRHAEFVDLRAA